MERRARDANKWQIFPRRSVIVSFLGEGTCEHSAAECPAAPRPPRRAPAPPPAPRAPQKKKRKKSVVNGPPHCHSDALSSSL